MRGKRCKVMLDLYTPVVEGKGRKVMLYIKRIIIIIVMY